MTWKWLVIWIQLSMSGTICRSISIDPSVCIDENAKKRFRDVREKFDIQISLRLICERGMIIPTSFRMRYLGGRAFRDSSFLFSNCTGRHWMFDFRTGEEETTRRLPCVVVCVVWCVCVSACHEKTWTRFPCLKLSSEFTKKIIYIVLRIRISQRGKISSSRTVDPSTKCRNVMLRKNQVNEFRTLLLLGSKD